MTFKSYKIKTALLGLIAIETLKSKRLSKHEGHHSVEFESCDNPLKRKTKNHHYSQQKSKNRP